MFNNKQETAKTTPTAGSHSINSLVTGTLVEGTISSDNDIRVDGTINGKLICKSKVIVGITGSIKGEVHCDSAVIEGKIEGTLKVNELLNVREQSVINGEVFTKKLIIASGAIFNVTCHMGNLDSKAKSNGKSTPKVAAEEA
jgi:cytoskeletal protein CcmA (bactofilin family)